MMTVFHINYEPDNSKALSGIEERVKSGKSGYICVADGNILTMVHKDLEYRKVVQGAMYSIVDSSWVPVLVKKLYGQTWQQYCGSQIFDDITRAGKYRMCFLGAKQEVLDALKGRMAEVDSAIGDMRFMELPFCKVEDFDYEGIAAAINNDSPDIIWISLGAPKQEIFASRLTPLLKKGVVIPVGAVFNFRSGLGIRRAPGWMVKCHIEFVWRIFSEPRKQIRRCWDIICTLPSIYTEEKKRVTNDKDI